MNKQYNVIAAVRGFDDLSEALDSGCKTVFSLAPSISDLEETVRKAHEKGKKIFIHIDLAEGIGKDKAGIEFCKRCGADGIISTRVNLIKTAHDMGLFTVQRFFAVDSHSLETTVEGQKNSKADMIEIMPGIIPKIIKKLKENISVPIIAGGLIETKDEVEDALLNGAAAVSTGKKALWDL